MFVTLAVLLDGRLCYSVKTVKARKGRLEREGAAHVARDPRYTFTVQETAT